MDKCNNHLYKEDIKDFNQNINDFISKKLFNQNKNPDKELIEDIKNNKLVIYTAITNDYDKLNNPEFIDENCDYICFTDNEDLKSDFWDIILMNDSNLDNNKKSKEYKLFPNKFLSNYKYSIWMDAYFQIKSSMREYLYKFANSSLLCLPHPRNSCFYKEAQNALIIYRYPNVAINKEINDYKTEFFPLDYGLASSGVLFRKHNDSKIIKLMNDWWEEIINYTNQDQLSFPHVMWKNNFKPSVSKLFVWDNEFWKFNGIHNHDNESKNYLTSLNLIKNIEGNIKEENTLSKEEIKLLLNDIDVLKEEADLINRYKNVSENRIVNMTNSLSWKITKPLRSFVRFIKNRDDNEEEFA